MFCPQCKAEYRPGFIWCSDCDIELVDHLPLDAVTSQEAENSSYVVVATVQGSLEESQICSFLEANDIPAQVQQREGVLRKLYGINVNGFGAVQILVPREFAGTAIDLLAKADRGELEIDAENGETPTGKESR
jgi:hypothetical protein